MDNRLILVLISAFLLGSCTKEAAVDGGEEVKSVTFSLSLNTLSVDDPTSINDDQTFSSLAVYVFNDDATFSLDKSALLPSFSSVSTMEIPIKTQEGGKIVYLIANYSGKSFRRGDQTALTLRETTTKEQLDDLVVESASGFVANSLVMLGRRSIDVSEATHGSFVSVPLRRLQARVDVHVYKGENFGANSVTLESITLRNQVLNSEARFDDPTMTPPQMLTSPMLNSQLVTSSSTLLEYIPGTVVQPQDSEAIFYSYQNIVSVFSPIEVSAPYLEIDINSNGTTFTYRGYLTDANQTASKYSLLQNNVYQITAILDIDSKIILNMEVLPWEQTDIEYERPVTPGDFTFGEWGSSWGGINGKSVHTNMDGLEDAVFEFDLTAPVGAAWTATLTNGLDFLFTPSTAGLTTAAVSSGFAGNSGPAVVAVRAAKRWGGNTRDTELYITVEGDEIPINPVVGGQRKYEGSDTRIKIMQVASSN